MKEMIFVVSLLILLVKTACRVSLVLVSFFPIYSLSFFLPFSLTNSRIGNRNIECSVSYLGSKYCIIICLHIQVETRLHS